MEKRRKKTPEKLAQTALREYALRLLGGRGYTVAEIRRKLKSRAANAADIDAVLDRLTQYGFLDDRRYADAYARSRLENEGHGEARVRRDLRRKNVPDSIVEEAVTRVFAETDEVVLVERFLKRKFRRVALGEYLAEPKHMAAAYRRLRYAGFSSSNSIRVLKRYSQQAERLEGMEEE